MICLRNALLGGVALTLVGLVGGQPAAAEEAKELFFYNWTDYYPVELLTKFEQETGIKVIMDGYDSNETLLAKLQAGGGGYDVIVPSDYLMKTLTAENLVMEIDAPSMANFKYVREAFRDPDFDPGRKYTVPYLWGTTGIAYDSAQVPGGKLDDSWKEFFEPRPELVGKIAALDISSSLYVAAAHYVGVDQCTENPEDAKKILDVLLKQKPSLKLYSADSTVDRMAAGEVAMHQLWNGATARAQKQRPSIRYIYPKEGTPMFRDNFAIPTGAPHPENAKIFLNWMMDPQNAAAVSNAIAYANAIESEQYLNEEWRKSEAINMPADFSDRLRPEIECDVKGRELRDKVWAKLKG